MTDAIIVAIIAALPPTIVALLALRKSTSNGKAVAEVHLALNSRLDELLRSTRTAAHAAGVKEGQEGPPAKGAVSE